MIIDGARPKNAVCPSCRYHLGGVEVMASSLVCPECGCVCSLDRHVKSPRPIRRFMLLPVLALLAVLVAFAAGVSQSVWTIIGLAVVFTIAVIGLYQLREMMTGE